MRRSSTSQAGASSVLGNVREIWQENVEASEAVGDCSDIVQPSGGLYWGRESWGDYDKPQHLVESALVFVMVGSLGMAPSDRTVHC